MVKLMTMSIIESKLSDESGVLCDRKVPHKVKVKFYRTAIRPAVLYGSEFWAAKRQ